jgi:hypothetical protein
LARSIKDEAVEPATGDTATRPAATNTEIPLTTLASFAVTASPRPFIDLAETSPVAHPNYNPHSA